MKRFKRITSETAGYLDDPSRVEQAAALEAQRVIARASDRLPPDPSLQPMPFFSWKSLRDVITIGGRYPLIRYDGEG